MSTNNIVLQVPSFVDEFPFPYFAKPLEVGYYSTDKENQLHFDKSGLALYSPPPPDTDLNLDLNDGFERLIEHRHRLPGDLDKLLKYILEEKRRRSEFTNKNELFAENEKNIPLKDIVYGADIVCWRGIFTFLAASPYEREDWMFGAVRFRGVLFLMEFKTEDEEKKYTNMTDRDKLMTFWGHRFEPYVTKSTRNSGAVTADDDAGKECIVDCNEQFCVVYRTKLAPSEGNTTSKQFRFFYGAEVDGVDEKGRYIELKTSRIIENARQEFSFKKFKLLKWWLQSFLAGIDRVICGHRNDAGFVKYLTTYSVADMPRFSNGQWSPSTCMHFLYDLLLFVDKHTPESAQENCLGEISIFQFYPLSKQVRLVGNHSYTSDQILPDWFVQDFGKA